jgi:hypothetical protein
VRLTVIVLKISFGVELCPAVIGVTQSRFR